MAMWGQFSAMRECSIVIVFTVGKGMLTQQERTRTQKIDIASKLATSFSMVELKLKSPNVVLNYIAFDSFSP